MATAAVRHEVFSNALSNKACRLGHLDGTTQTNASFPSRTNLGSCALRRQGMKSHHLRSADATRHLTVNCAQNGILEANTETGAELKRAVAKKAISKIKSGMTVSIGTGSTSFYAIEELGSLVKAGKLKDVYAVMTTFQCKVSARQHGIKMLDLNDVAKIDISIQGADEVDPQMNLIKGGGAAHTMEKVVTTVAKESIIIVDQSKVSPVLGTSFAVPVEVIPQAITPVVRALAALGGYPEIRSALKKDGPVMTDLGNMIVDVRFPDGISDPPGLEKLINNIPGVVDNGLFCGIVQKVLVATKEGDVITVVELADAVKNIFPTSSPAS
eukprot:TRINITY_DN451_c0_g1_i2.p1 TRINITY_DN451_c0_g1~~TRINITY_DN451_c0_g1_i2.p1  ORF type:complete len:327 (-),score=59.71 TRINITY_DN451_c0_g1_i2:594-1574(-)